jgi:hypothetical protein
MAEIFSEANINSWVFARIESQDKYHRDLNKTLEHI